MGFAPLNPSYGFGQIDRTSPRHERDLHLRIGELAAVDDHVVVERDGAVAHRHVVMALGGALAAALRVRAGGEQEVAGKTAGTGVVALGVGAVQRNRIPARLRRLGVAFAALGAMFDLHTWLAPAATTASVGGGEASSPAISFGTLAVVIAIALVAPLVVDLKPSWRIPKPFRPRCP